MGRSIKTGLSYFPLDTDIRSDRKIKRLEREFPVVGLYIYIILLLEIYRDTGHYLNFNDDLIFDLSDSIPKKDENLVRNIILFLVNNDLFDKKIFETKNIITSVGIQKRYKFIINQLRRIADIDPDINILNISSEDKPITSEGKNHLDSNHNSKPTSSEEITKYSETTKINDEEKQITSEEIKTQPITIDPNQKASFFDSKTISSEDKLISSKDIIKSSKEMVINSEFSTQKKIKGNRINNIYIPFDIKTEDFLEVFLEKNFPQSEINRFLNYYSGLGWESNNKKIKNPIALAKLWKQENGNAKFLPIKVHQAWWKIWLEYKLKVGQNKAQFLLYIKPKLIENKLVFICTEKTKVECEDDNIDILQSSIKRNFGNNIILEYYITDNADKKQKIVNI